MSADPEHLAAIHAGAFPDPWSAETLAQLLAQPGVAVLSEPDGFIVIRTVLDEAEVLTLAVRPHARRRGVATRLVQKAAELARLTGAERLFLEVAEDNHPAQALYARAGFSRIGRRAGYYARPEGAVAALVLARPLP